MPTYEYACTQCGHEMEAFQLMSAPPLVDCPACETPSLKRKIGLGAGVIFKGGGFYETDFKDKKGKKDESPSKKDTSSSTESKASADKKEAAEKKPAKTEG